MGRSCEVDVWGSGGGGRWFPISDGDDVFGVRMGAAGVVLPHSGGFYVFGGERRWGRGLTYGVGGYGVRMGWIWGGDGVRGLWGGDGVDMG